jgi:hypothetical protein
MNLPIANYGRRISIQQDKAPNLGSKGVISVAGANVLTWGDRFQSWEEACTSKTPSDASDFTLSLGDTNAVNRG